MRDNSLWNATGNGNKLQKKRPSVSVESVSDEKASSSTAAPTPRGSQSRRISTATLRSSLAKHLADLSARLEKPSATSFSTSSTAYVKGLTDKGPPKASKYFRSRRINRKELDIAWLQKQGFDWIGYLLPIIGALLGLMVATLLIWNKTRVIVNANYCNVLNEDWSNGFNEDIWMKEVQTNGFG